MARIVIAGSADCPYYARIELLADKLVKNLPDFNLHKIVIQPAEWETWLETTCEERDWRHHRSPIVWRELVDRGGKGMLIGSANEFQEYVHNYYGTVSDFSSIDMRKIGQENTKTKDEIDEELRQFKALSNPIHVCITNAASLAAYNMVAAIAKGESFGSDTEIALHFLVPTDQLDEMDGIEMEAFDLACPLLRKTSVTDDPLKAFKDCTAVILADEIIRPKDDDGEYQETEEDWLKRNAEVFTKYGQCLDQAARRDVRVIIASQTGPINFNAAVLAKNCKNVSKQNIVGVSRMVERRAKATLAQRLTANSAHNVNSGHVVDVIVWGNTNKTHHIDTTNSRVHLYDGAIWGPPWYSRKIAEMVHDDKWLATEFLTTIAARRELMETAMKHSAAVSLATAVVTCVDHWWNGSPPGQNFSMTVCSQGWYEIPEDVFFSFPVTMGPPGYWSVVQDIEVGDETKTKFKEIVQELQAELDLVYPPPKPPTPTPTPSIHESVGRDSARSSNRSSVQENVDEINSQQDNESVRSGASEKKVFGEAAEDVAGEAAEENAEPQKMEE